MPLFKSSHPDSAAEDTTVNETPTHRGSIFSRRRHAASPESADTNTHNATDGAPTNRSGGFFSRHRDEDSSSSLSDHSGRHGATAAGAGAAESTTSGHGFFGNKMRDASLDAAKGKVYAAELAEKEADKALVAARRAVTEAKEHAHTLENEANEQARLAHEKVMAAREVKSDAGRLGKHN